MYTEEGPVLVPALLLLTLPLQASLACMDASSRHPVTCRAATPAAAPGPGRLDGMTSGDTQEAATGAGGLQRPPDPGHASSATPAPTPALTHPASAACMLPPSGSAEGGGVAALPLSEIERMRWRGWGWGGGCSPRLVCEGSLGQGKAV